MLEPVSRGWRAALGAAWQDTLIAIGTEFGRTVAVNGTNARTTGRPRC